MKLIDSMIETVRVSPRENTSMWEVLHLFFCTPDNWYKWKRGQLVRRFPILKEEEAMTEKGAAGVIYCNDRFPVLRDLMVGGEIFNLPQDIQPDWFWGAEQIIEKIEKFERVDYEALCRVYYMGSDKSASVFELNFKSDLSMFHKWKREIKKARSRLESIRAKRGDKFKERVSNFDIEYQTYMVKVIYGNIKPATQNKKSPRRIKKKV